MAYSEQTKIKIEAYFREKWGMWDYTRGWLKSDCPFCGKEKKFGIQLEDNKAHCFSCEHKSTLIQAIFELENLKQYNEVYNLLKHYGSTTFYKPTTKLKKSEDTKALSLPEEFKLLGLYSSKTAKIVEANLRRRGFKIRKLMRKGVGYCASGPYGGRIIIPYYEAGRLVYFNARKFIDIGEKFKNPTAEECGIGKSSVIYNVDALELYDKIYLFESTTNCLTMGDNAIGTGGKSLSAIQKNKILRSPVKEIVIGLDDDAYVNGLKLAMEFCGHKKVKVLEFPPKKDANVIGRKATRELEKSTPFLSYGQLYKLYLKHKYE